VRRPQPEPRRRATVNAAAAVKAVLILNDSAGSLNGEQDAVPPGELVGALRAEGVEAELRRVVPRQLCATVRAAVTQRPDAVFVGGGDGSISAAAGCLAGTGITLGVLPLGTLNHFARDLGLPGDWRQVVRALARGRIAEVDVGEVNGRVFINNCSLGSYAEAVRQRDALRAERGLGKWAAMTLATLAVFWRLRRLRLRVELAGQPIALRTPFVVVSNNRYSAHVLDYSLRPRLDAAELCLYATRARGRLPLLSLAWQTLRRHIDEVDGLDTHAFAEATITGLRPRPLPIAVDGELVDLPPPLRFRVRPRALRVLAPLEPVRNGK
jgi:diacylglycerol kinase family enzyme